MKYFANAKTTSTFAIPNKTRGRDKENKRELSSAGSEHLPYKQRVGGSNPSAPTLNKKGLQSAL